MDQLVKLNSQTAGRDKIARLLQYVSRITWHKLQENRKDGVDILKNLEFQLSSFRKLLRFGKCIDVLYSVLLSFKTGDDYTVKVTGILGKISNSIFLLADHILWLGRSDFCLVDTDKWSKICSQYWLYSICMNLIRDIYEVLKIIQLHKEEIIPSKGVKNILDILKTCCKTLIYIQKYPHVTVDIIKNSCDIFLPLAALGYLNLSPSALGTFGAISSIAGLIVLLRPSCKLSP